MLRYITDGADSLQIHYDNVGTDSGEAVEIIFPTGSTVTLQKYNGGNNLVDGSALTNVTAARALGSTGFTIATIPAPGLQNGSPDGIALICNGAVIQFLSYEGTFTAADGPAAGRLSTDIGVAEAGETLLCLAMECFCCSWDCQASVT